LKELLEYPEKQRAELARIEPEIEKMPESIKVRAHAHSLRKSREVNDSQYICAVCRHPGRGWVLHL
jgi:hypothetical protein